MRDVGAAQRAAGRSRSRLLRLLAVVLAVALGGQPVPTPRLETVSTQHPAPSTQHPAPPASVLATPADSSRARTWVGPAQPHPASRRTP